MLIESLGVWEGLSPEEVKQFTAEAIGREALENILVLSGEWSAMTLEEKQAVLQTQIDTEEIRTSIEYAGLWNNAEFVSKFANIDTNAPDAEEKIRNLLSEWGIVLPQDTKVLNTQTNAGETAPVVQEYQEAVNNTQDKTVGVTSNLFGMVANLVTMGLYKIASDNLEDKNVTASTAAPTAGEDAKSLSEFNTESSEMKSTSATATTSVPNVGTNSQNLATWNVTSDEMKDNSSTAHTYTPGMSYNTNLSDSWNLTTDKLKDKSSTATTSAPNAGYNTGLVNNWNAAMNASYSKTSVMTTIYEKIYRTVGKHATGGHIGMFAKGGNISQWGGMFANGGNVPQGYTGIVGEAGPEIFQVSRKGVSITPLSTREKMRGIKGVLEEHGGGNANSIVINVNIDGPVLKEDVDITKLAKVVGEQINRQVKLEQIFKKGKLAT